mmetsp:Transcript_113035/g.365008  ORF Transcript_113035/g.365008 Transcript_113035/m.365008 type:complete len:293 (+) Transcript_113035:130-1008(+)
MKLPLGTRGGCCCCPCCGETCQTLATGPDMEALARRLAGLATSWQPRGPASDGAALPAATELGAARSLARAASGAGPGELSPQEANPGGPKPLARSGCRSGAPGVAAPTPCWLPLSASESQHLGLSAQLAPGSEPGGTAPSRLTGTARLAPPGSSAVIRKRLAGSASRPPAHGLAARRGDAGKWAGDQRHGASAPCQAGLAGLAGAWPASASAGREPGRCGLESVRCTALTRPSRRCFSSSDSSGASPSGSAVGPLSVTLGTSREPTGDAVARQACSERAGVGEASPKRPRL